MKFIDNWQFAQVLFKNSPTSAGIWTPTSGAIILTLQVVLKGIKQSMSNH